MTVSSQIVTSINPLPRVSQPSSREEAYQPAKTPVNVANLPGHTGTDRRFNGNVGFTTFNSGRGDKPPVPPKPTGLARPVVAPKPAVPKPNGGFSANTADRHGTLPYFKKQKPPALFSTSLAAVHAVLEKHQPVPSVPARPSELLVESKNLNEVGVAASKKDEIFAGKRTDWFRERHDAERMPPNLDNVDYVMGLHDRTSSGSMSDENSADSRRSSESSFDTQPHHRLVDDLLPPASSPAGVPHNELVNGPELPPDLSASPSVPESDVGKESRRVRQRGAARFREAQFVAKVVGNDSAKIKEAMDNYGNYRDPSPYKAYQSKKQGITLKSTIHSLGKKVGRLVSHFKTTRLEITSKT